ncbi:carbamoyltransferase HypF [bacterium]|nr:carbamoyltransferase HypF [bacterium]
MQRRQIDIDGVVQGVGFRPFVYREALKLGLSGFVTNTPDGVQVEAQGRAADLDRFVRILQESAPVRSIISRLSAVEIPVQEDGTFTIRHSRKSVHRRTLISPDIATCDHCIRELFDPQNRRYLYPFINCTECGPRYTIIQDIPYDRPRTTMSAFTMCPDCEREYRDPGDRRFHAQPNACPVCGPHVWLTDAEGNPVQTADPFSMALDFLEKDQILAVKGLGGFHLVCDAGSPEAVKRLRIRKNREEKPLAVMVKNVKVMQTFADADDHEIALLCSHERPIVLVKKKRPFSLAPNVAPDNGYIGVMLPYTPLHHLLFRGALAVLVMTSGNISEEPIAFENDEALNRLGTVADYFLMHNRDIFIRCDDSVSMFVHGAQRLVRRSRGMAPLPVFVPERKRQTLAVGGELKNTVAFAKKDRVYLSHYIGDLENAETMASFVQALTHFQKIMDIRPGCIVHDLHPEYLSTQWALQQENLIKIPVQHHFAHIVSCMAENRVLEPVIGLALDGTGYGTDGQIWGGEVLTADYTGYERMAHLDYRAMPGGSAAIRDPWRMALSCMHAWQKPDPSGLDAWIESLRTDLFRNIPDEHLRAAAMLIVRKINTPMTSSMGRLFDAVSFLCGCCEKSTYEGQPAMMLERLMPDRPELSGLDGYPDAFSMNPGENPVRIGFDGLIRMIVEDVLNRVPVSDISTRFHLSVADLFVDLCRSVFEKTGIRRVALSGGCFQNRFLLSRISSGLERRELTVLSHRHVPCNDAGLSLGQAVIGQWASPDG